MTEFGGQHGREELIERVAVAIRATESLCEDYREYACAAVHAYEEWDQERMFDDERYPGAAPHPSTAPGRNPRLTYRDAHANTSGKLRNFESLGCDRPRGGPVARVQWLRFRWRMTKVLWKHDHVSLEAWDAS